MYSFICFHLFILLNARIILKEYYYCDLRILKKLLGLIYINILNYRNADYFIDIIINEKVSIHYGK